MIVIDTQTEDVSVGETPGVGGVAAAPGQDGHVGQVGTWTVGQGDGLKRWENKQMPTLVIAFTTMIVELDMYLRSGFGQKCLRAPPVLLPSFTVVRSYHRGRTLYSCLSQDLQKINV